MCHYGKGDVSREAAVFFFSCLEMWSSDPLRSVVLSSQMYDGFNALISSLFFKWRLSQADVPEASQDHNEQSETVVSFSFTHFNKMPGSWANRHVNACKGRWDKHADIFTHYSPYAPVCFCLCCHVIWADFTITVVWLFLWSWYFWFTSVKL